MVRTVKKLETIIGNIYADYNTSYLVDLGDGRYTEKRGSDLQDDDAIYIKNKSAVIKEILYAKLMEIQDQLGYVDSILEKKIPRYYLAKYSTYKKNSEGILIPYFRIQLLRGFSAATDENIDNLEDKIMRDNGMDFTKQQYEDFAGMLFPNHESSELDDIEGNSSYVTVQKSTVRELWLKLSKHSSASPDNWENLNGLATYFSEQAKKATNDKKRKTLEEVAKEFSDMYQSQDHNFGFHKQRYLHKGTRKTVMRRLNHIAGIPAEKIDERDNKPQREGKYDKEVAAVVASILPYLEDDIIPIPINKITDVKKSHARLDPDSLNLGDILLKADDSAEHKGEKIDMTTIDKHAYLINLALEETIKRYFSQREQNPFYSKILTDKDSEYRFNFKTVYTLEIFSRLITLSSSEENFKNKYMRKLRLENLEKTEMKRQIEDDYLEFLRQVYDNGKMDNFLSLKEGTIEEMIKSLNTYRQALPKAFYEWQEVLTKVAEIMPDFDSKISSPEAIINHLNNIAEIRKRNKPLFDTEEKKRKYLENHYAIFPTKRKMLLVPYVSFEVKKEYSSKGYGRSLEEQRELFYWANTLSLRNNGTKYFKRKEVKEILENAGFEDAINLFDPLNFAVAKRTLGAITGYISRPKSVRDSDNIKK